MSEEQSDTVNKGRRVTIDLTPAATREVDRLRQITALSTADIFRHAMTLFRIYVDAKTRGEELHIIDPIHGKSNTRLEIPLSLEEVKK